MDEKVVTGTIKSYRPNIVLNAADKAEQEPEKAFAISCDGVRNLALACAYIKISLLHISIDYVFHAGTNLPGQYSSCQQKLTTVLRLRSMRFRPVNTRHQLVDP